MLYSFADYLTQFYGGFNLFQYLTFQINARLRVPLRTPTRRIRTADHGETPSIQEASPVRASPTASRMLFSAFGTTLIGIPLISVCAQLSISLRVIRQRGAAIFRTPLAKKRNREQSITPIVTIKEKQWS